MANIFRRIVEKTKQLYSMARMRYYFGEVGGCSSMKRPSQIYNGKDVTVGNKVYINYGLRLECIEQFNGKCFSPKIEIGDMTNIEQNVHITSAGKVSIGKECSILGFCTITDIIHPYKEIDIAPKYQDFEVKEVWIGDQSMIGMGARIMPRVRIGKHCVIGANAVVTKDIPDYSVAVGVPAVVIKRYSNEAKEYVTVDNG